MAKRKLKTTTVKTQYVFCERQKGQHRKHIDVCLACRKRKKCEIYQSFMQPSLPFK